MKIYMVVQASKLTGLSRFTIAQACREGRIAAVKLGHDWLIPVEALREAIAAGRIRPKRPVEWDSKPAS